MYARLWYTCIEIFYLPYVFFTGTKCAPQDASYSFIGEGNPALAVLQIFRQPTNIGGALDAPIAHDNLGLEGVFNDLSIHLEGQRLDLPEPLVRTKTANIATDRPFGYVSPFEVIFAGLTGPCVSIWHLVRRRAPMVVSGVDSNGLVALNDSQGAMFTAAQLGIDVFAPATGLSSYNICRSSNATLASHLTLSLVSTGVTSQVNLLADFTGMTTIFSNALNFTIDLCMTDNGFNKTSMYNNSLYESWHTASSHTTVTLEILQGTCVKN